MTGAPRRRREARRQIAEHAEALVAVEGIEDRKAFFRNRAGRLPYQHAQSLAGEGGNHLEAARIRDRDRSAACGMIEILRDGRRDDGQSCEESEGEAAKSARAQCRGTHMISGFSRQAKRVR
jgi:hypothetical protein